MTRRGRAAKDFAELELGHVKEATLRDFLRGLISADRLAAEVRAAVERSGSGRRVHIQDLPPGEEVTVTADMLVRLCDAALAGDLAAADLEIVAFAIVASDRLHSDTDNELVGRVLYDWAVPEVNGELTAGSMRMFRGWLTGEVRPPSEPDLTADSFSSMRLLRRISKVSVPGYVG